MSVAEKPDVRPATVQARCVRLPAKAADAASISPVIETQTLSRGENDLLIELKAARAFDSSHESQTLNYLRATDVEVGLLMNFGPKPEFKRFLFDNERKAARAVP